jgi:multisubunit Na+/H+ antiporter MnhB subunit
LKFLILSTATRVLTPLILAFSVFVLLRGHNAPGGGFIGGLIAATAFCLYVKSEGAAAARGALRVEPAGLAMIGAGLALAAGLWGLAAEGAFLAGVWPLLSNGADGGKNGLPVGSILLFDSGVYLVVVGAVSAIFFALEEEAEDPPSGAGDGGEDA